MTTSMERSDREGVMKMKMKMDQPRQSEATERV